MHFVKLATILFIIAGVVLGIALIGGAYHSITCEKEPYYYRFVGAGGIFGGTYKVETTKEQMDGIDYRCKK